MLVLTRKKQETIRIGDNITVTVLRIKGKSVRLGIEAPLQQSVLRGELTAFETDETVGDVISSSETDTPLPSVAQSTENPQWRRLPTAELRQDAAATLCPTAPLKSLVRSRGDASASTHSVMPLV